MRDIRDDEVELARQQSRLSRGEGTSQPVIEHGRKESSQAMLSHALVLANQKRGTTRRCRRGVVLRSEVQGKTRHSATNARPYSALPFFEVHDTERNNVEVKRDSN